MIMGPRPRPPRRATWEEPPTALRHCERCGFPTFKLHCKVRCPNCGHFLDCGDLDIPGSVGPRHVKRF